MSSSPPPIHPTGGGNATHSQSRGKGAYQRWRPYPTSTLDLTRDNSPQRSGTHATIGDTKEEERDSDDPHLHSYLQPYTPSTPSLSAIPHPSESLALPPTPIVPFEPVDITSNGSFVMQDESRTNKTTQQQYDFVDSTPVKVEHTEPSLGNASFEDFIRDPSLPPASPSSQVQAAKAALVEYRAKAARGEGISANPSLATSQLPFNRLQDIPSQSLNAPRHDLIDTPSSGGIPIRSSPETEVVEDAKSRVAKAEADHAHKARATLLVESAVSLLIDIWEAPLAAQSPALFAGVGTERQPSKLEDIEIRLEKYDVSPTRPQFPMTPASSVADSPLSSRSSASSTLAATLQRYRTRARSHIQGRAANLPPAVMAASKHVPTPRPVWSDALPTPPTTADPTKRFRTRGGDQHQASSIKPDSTPKSPVSPTPSASSPNSSIPLRTFVLEVLRRSRTGCSALEAGMCYLEAVRSRVQVSRQQKESAVQRGILDQDESEESPLLCPRRCFLAAMLLASKFLQDKAYSNKAWAKLSGLQPLEVGRCERALGDALGWRLWVGRGMEWPSAEAVVGEEVAAGALISGSGRDRIVIETSQKTSSTHTTSSLSARQCSPTSLKRIHGTLAAAPVASTRTLGHGEVRLQRSFARARYAVNPYPKISHVRRDSRDGAGLGETDTGSGDYTIPALLSNEGIDHSTTECASPALTRCSSNSSHDDHSSGTLEFETAAELLTNFATAAIYQIPSAWSSLASLQSAADARSETSRWGDGYGKVGSGPSTTGPWAFSPAGLADLAEAPLPTTVQPATRKRAAFRDTEKPSTYAHDFPGSEWSTMCFGEILGNA